MSLYMVHIEAVPRYLFEWGRSMEPNTNVMLRDLGYLIHSALRASFGEVAPQPFEVFPQANGQKLKILGYAGYNQEDIQKNLVFLVEPLLMKKFLPNNIYTKPIPEQWPEGKKFGFRVRCCPVVRKRSSENKVIEKDAYLAACDKCGQENLDRNNVYVQWLSEQFTRLGGAKLIQVRVKSFRLLELRRRSKNCLHKVEYRPEVIFEGILGISESEEFRLLLQRGVGRHRAFGFGALFLRSV